MTEQDRQLILRHLDAQLGQEDESRLAELLQSDPQARAFLRNVAEQAVVVADMHRMELSGQKEANARLVRVSGQRSTDGQTKIPRSRRARWRWAMATVAVVLIAAVYFLRPIEKSAIATITDAGGALRWTGDGGQVTSELQIGLPLGGGTLESLSADSWVGIEFRDGSSVTISGQSVLTISQRARKQLYLRRGRLSARVTPQPAGKPMLVHTPTAELEVLGTQFNVEAESSATVLAVNEGSVRLKRLTDGKVIEVPAEFQAYTSIDEQNGLTLTSRRSATYSWQGDLTRDVICGKWVSELEVVAAILKKAVVSGTMTEAKAIAEYKAAADLGDERGVLYATPWLVKHSKSGTEANVSHLVVMKVARRQKGPVLIDGGSKFRVRGRVEPSSAHVTFGFTAHALGGGFAGKYSTTRAVKVANVGGDFDIEIPLSEFHSMANAKSPSKKQWATSPVGQELVEWWCSTTGRNVSLAVTHVEFLGSASTP